MIENRFAIAVLACLQLAALAAGCRAAGDGDEAKGFVSPVGSTETVIGASELAQGAVKFSCWDYGAFAVAQVSDPGLMGAKELELRYPGTGGQAGLCARDFSGERKALLAEAGYFSGSGGDFIFLDEADSFGGMQEFRVIEVKSGKEVFRAERFGRESMTISRGKKTSLKFAMGLKADCPLARDGAKCWIKILAANAVPAGARLKAPDCLPSFKAYNSPLENTAQLATDVLVENLARPRVKYLGGPVYCQPAP